MLLDKNKLQAADSEKQWGKKPQEKVVSFVFSEKREGTVKKHSPQPRDLLRRGERHGSLLTDLVGQTMLVKVETLEVLNPPMDFKEGSWGVCMVAGAQNVFT